MINAKAILKEVKGLTRYFERMVMDYETRDFYDDCQYYGNIPEPLLVECAKMYIRQGKKNGRTEFPVWLHSIYKIANPGMQDSIGYAVDNLRADGRFGNDYTGIVRIMQMKPNNVLIDVEKLIEDLDDMANEYEIWIKKMAFGDEYEPFNTESVLEKSEGDFAGVVEKTISYSAAKALSEIDGAMHYIKGEKVVDGMIKVAVDKRYINKKFSGEYEKITAPYSICKSWNKRNPPEMRVVFLSYDKETGICTAIKPKECTINENKEFNNAYSYKRRQYKSGKETIEPPVIRVEDLNVEVPECLLN